MKSVPALQGLRLSQSTVRNTETRVASHLLYITKDVEDTIERRAFLQGFDTIQKQHFSVALIFIFFIRLFSTIISIQFENRVLLMTFAYISPGSSLVDKFKK